MEEVPTEFFFHGVTSAQSLCNEKYDPSTIGDNLMIKLALTDLDDTLIPVGAPRASDHSLAAIHAMLDAGLYFGPVSGRVPNAMGWMFGGDEACYATGAFANGQMVYVDGELVHEETLSTEALQHAADVLDDGVDGAVIAVYDVYGDGDAALVTSNPSRLEAYPEINAEVGRPTLHDLGDGMYVKANVHVAGDAKRRAEVRDLLRRECPELDFVFPSLTAPFVDITPHGWDKGAGVRELARNLGVDLDEVVTFGDSENDLAMLRAVPNSVAVANASAEVRKAARWHIGASADDAVADALLDIAHAAATESMPTFMQ